MMNKFEIKQEEEKQLLKYFKKAYPDFPKGRIFKTESPDFIIKIKRHRSIGIELTKLFLEKKKEDLDYFVPLFEGKKAYVIHQLQERILEYHGFPFFAHISFSEKDYHSDIDLDQISDQLYELIMEKLKYRSVHDYFGLTIKADMLAPWVQSLEILHHPSDKVLKLIACKENVNYDYILESLYHSIEMKEEKLNLYEKNWCDEYWLLIAAECLNCAAPFNVNNLIEHLKIESGFHRIFLFEIFKSKVHQLTLD